MDEGTVPDTLTSELDNRLISELVGELTGTPLVVKVADVEDSEYKLLKALDCVTAVEIPADVDFEVTDDTEALDVAL